MKSIKEAVEQTTTNAVIKMNEDKTVTLNEEAYNLLTSHVGATFLSLLEMMGIDEDTTSVIQSALAQYVVNLSVIMFDEEQAQLAIKHSKRALEIAKNQGEFDNDNVEFEGGKA